MPNLIKRHFYNGVHYKIDKENKRVVLLPEFHEKLKAKKLWNKFGFKKIGGSSVGDVLLQGNFNSPFNAFCRLAWIGMPILDRKYVDAGILIEPKVINVIEEKLAKDYAKPVKVTTFNPEQHNFDLFKNKDDVVGGIPDGFIKELSMILEIKTTNEKNYDLWQKFGLPESYCRQAQLYSYLIGAKTFVIVATFLREEDYLNPINFDIYNRKIKNWKFKLNDDIAKDDINKIKTWYIEVTSSGISPQYDELKDSDLIAWLECKSPLEWEALKEKWISEKKIVI